MSTLYKKTKPNFSHVINNIRSLYDVNYGALRPRTKITYRGIMFLYNTGFLKSGREMIPAKSIYDLLFRRYLILVYT